MAGPRRVSSRIAVRMLPEPHGYLICNHSQLITADFDCSKGSLKIKLEPLHPIQSIRRVNRCLISDGRTKSRYILTFLLIEAHLMSTQPTIFIIDDDQDVRESLQELLESVGLHSKSFGTAQEFLSTGCDKNNDEKGPSCLILDVRLPGISGLDLQHALKKGKVNIPIIFLSAHADVPMSVKAMKSGAVEFLTKPFRQQDLLDAVQRSLTRDRILREKQRDIAELLERYDELSAREREVMNLVVFGMINKQIAAELGASEATVKMHRSQVMKKMKAKSLPELVRMADKLKSSLKTIA